MTAKDDSKTYTEELGNSPPLRSLSSLSQAETREHSPGLSGVPGGALAPLPSAQQSRCLRQGMQSGRSARLLKTRCAVQLLSSR